MTNKEIEERLFSMWSKWYGKDNPTQEDTKDLKEYLEDLAAEL